MHHRKVFKNASIISLAILFSRLLGFVRDILVAALLGTGPLAQAFFVAFRIPNLFRDIVAEGAANSSIIPVLAESRLLYNRKDYLQIISSLQFVMISSLLLLIFIGEIGAQYVVSAIAPGFRADPVLFPVAVRLTRLLLPFLLFIGLFGLNMSILHTEERFLSTSLGQPLFNLVMIFSLFFWGIKMHQVLLSLVLGVWLGGLALIMAQVVELNRLGYRVFHFRPSFHPAVKKVFLLLGPRLVGTIIYHINILADTILASLSSIVGPGGIAAIYYASRLMQFPLAMFSISVAQAILPRLSHLNCSKPSQIKETFRRSLELVVFLIVPSSAFLMSESKPIVSILFKRGAFDDYSVYITSEVLFFYSMGLLFFAGIKILVSGFHSLQDTKTPVKTAGFSLLINIILNLILMFPMKIAGLALASTVAGGVNFLLLMIMLDKRIGFINGDFIIEIIKMLLAGVLVYAILSMVSLKYNFVFLIRTVIVAVGAYLIGCGILRIKIWRDFVCFFIERLVKTRS